jgi:hypothetical protein
VRRARSTLRRYVVANRLDHLWSLTFSPEHLPPDRDGVWDCIERFRRRLFSLLGDRVPMATVIEEGSEHGRLHVHFAIHGRVPVALVGEAWGFGHVWVEPPPKLRHVGARARLRLTSAYLTKYVAKDFTGSEFNRKRYSTTRGFQPARQSFGVGTRLEAVELVGALGPVEVWSSDSLEDWAGPTIWTIRLE